MVATSPAMNGDSTAGTMTLDTRPCHFTACEPAAASIAPMTPPISACEELDGMPNSQVMRFQMIAPASPANTTVSVTRPVSTRPLAIVAATLSDRNAPTRFSAADSADGDLRVQRPGGDGRRHRVGGVVEAVGEVEGQPGDDDQGQHNVVAHESGLSV